MRQTGGGRVGDGQDTAFEEVGADREPVEKIGGRLDDIRLAVDCVEFKLETTGAQSAQGLELRDRRRRWRREDKIKGFYPCRIDSNMIGDPGLRDKRRAAAEVSVRFAHLCQAADGAADEHPNRSLRENADASARRCCPVPPNGTRVSSFSRLRRRSEANAGRRG